MVWNYRNRWDAATLELCVKDFLTSQFVKICRAKKKHLAKGYAKVARAHFVLNLWLCTSLWSHNDKVLNGTTPRKDSTHDLSIVYWCQSNFRWSSSNGSFPFCIARWFDKTQRFFHTREALETRHWFSCLRTKVAKQKWPNRNTIHTAILLCDSKFHHQGIFSSTVIDWAND